METRFIDIRTISEAGLKIHFRATMAERIALASRFDIPVLHDLSVEGSFIGDTDTITFHGTMHISAERICGLTLKPFTEQSDYPLDLIFSSEPDQIKDDLTADIFPIDKGKIDLLATFSELLGLNLNPFPKSTSDYLDYHDSDDMGTENPFSILKKLKKGDAS
ncbi:MAG: hypothetical protein SPL08_02390 [Pseudomonadota bacterium]|nr:hypothetical protein [Pseudomonadota bacterium]